MPHHAAPPFVEYVGINAVPDEDGAVVAEVELVQHLLNRSGAAHGGLIATLLDTTLARAAIAGDGGGRGRLATVEMNVTYGSACAAGHGAADAPRTWRFALAKCTTTPVPSWRGVPRRSGIEPRNGSYAPTTSQPCGPGS